MLINITNEDWELLQEACLGHARSIDGWGAKSQLKVVAIDALVQRIGEQVSARAVGRGFTPAPGCGNCQGTGKFSDDSSPAAGDGEDCIFCLEDAIRSGEIDGTIGGCAYRGGQPTHATFPGDPR